MFTYIFYVISFFAACGLAFLFRNLIQEAAAEAFKLIQEHKAKGKDSNDN